MEPGDKRSQLILKPNLSCIADYGAQCTQKNEQRYTYLVARVGQYMKSEENGSLWFKLQRDLALNTVRCWHETFPRPNLHLCRSIFLALPIGLCEPRVRCERSDDKSTRAFSVIHVFASHCLGCFQPKGLNCEQALHCHQSTEKSSGGKRKCVHRSILHGVAAVC